MEGDISYRAILFIIAWFLQMGFHEGGHAYAAYQEGDDTAYLLGKRSINPLAHIEWNNFNSILMSVIFPCITAIGGMVPMGMASVPVNPRRMKRHEKSMAWVSFAGPLGNFILMAACLLLHFLTNFLPYTNLERILHHTGSMQWGVGGMVWMFDQLLFSVYLTSMVYALFNLVPIPPLDGSKVLRYFLPREGKNMIDQIAPYGFTIIMIVFWVGNGGVILDKPIEFFARLWGSI
jgi:Zn-dependent protease